MAETTLADLPMDVASAVKKCNEDQTIMFWDRYNREKRSVGAMVALAILFPIHFFFLDKTGLGIAYILTLGFGVIGWIVVAFLTPGWTREYNGQRARGIVSDMRLMGV